MYSYLVVGYLGIELIPYSTCLSKLRRVYPYNPSAPSRHLQCLYHPSGKEHTYMYILRTYSACLSRKSFTSSNFVGLAWPDDANFLRDMTRLCEIPRNHRGIRRNHGISNRLLAVPTEQNCGGEGERERRRGEKKKGESKR